MKYVTLSGHYDVIAIVTMGTIANSGPVFDITSGLEEKIGHKP
jgi:hypothetical protein